MMGEIKIYAQVQEEDYQIQGGITTLTLIAYPKPGEKNIDFVRGEKYEYVTYPMIINLACHVKKTVSPPEGYCWMMKEINTIYGFKTIIGIEIVAVKKDEPPKADEAQKEIEELKGKLASKEKDIRYLYDRAAKFEKKINEIRSIAAKSLEIH